MGWCHQFGTDIQPGCEHPMEAASDCCHCRTCGVVCEGRFGGCASVWAGATMLADVGAPPARPDDPILGVTAFTPAVAHEAVPASFMPLPEPALQSETPHRNGNSRDEAANGDAGRSVATVLRALAGEVGRLADEVARQGSALDDLRATVDAASVGTGAELDARIAAQIAAQIATDVAAQVSASLIPAVASSQSAATGMLDAEGELRSLLGAVATSQETAAAGILDAETELRSLLGAVVSWVSELGDRVDDRSTEHLG